MILKIVLNFKSSYNFIHEGLPVVCQNVNFQMSIVKPDVECTYKQYTERKFRKKMKVFLSSCLQHVIEKSKRSVSMYDTKRKPNFLSFVQRADNSTKKIMSCLNLTFHGNSSNTTWLRGHSKRHQRKYQRDEGSGRKITCKVFVLFSPLLSTDLRMKKKKLHI